MFHSLSLEPKALLCSCCQFQWCKSSHHGQVQCRHIPECRTQQLVHDRTAGSAHTTRKRIIETNALLRPKTPTTLVTEPVSLPSPSPTHVTASKNIRGKKLDFESENLSLHPRQPLLSSETLRQSLLRAGPAALSVK